VGVIGPGSARRPLHPPGDRGDGRPGRGDRAFRWGARRRSLLGTVDSGAYAARAVRGKVTIWICGCVVILGGHMAAPVSASPFDGRGMWIWDLSRSDGGDPSAIAARAAVNGIRTVFVKSGDGATYFPQFSAGLVSALHRAGVSVCAWQFVYGTDPVAEALVAARAVRAGADCLVIDAEATYEGRYTQAQAYLAALRAAVGARYPVGLASFPYADDHPAFPYSVFLGHGGATFNLPQMYWQDIGESPAGVYAHTYADNGIYRRPIRPLGETTAGVSALDVETFRGLAVAYHAGGISWWDYAWTTADGLWGAVSGPYLAAAPPASSVPVLSEGSQGDMVVWLQELLASVVPSQGIDGVFGPQTAQNLTRFQRRRGITPTGQTGPLTWRALLRLRVVRVHFAADVRTALIARGGVRVLAIPRSASLPAVRDEIRPPTSDAPGSRTPDGSALKLP